MSKFELSILERILHSKVLRYMFYRLSIDYFVPSTVCEELTRKYVTFWYFLINNHKLQVMILNEMAHLPYSYIGYLIFKEMGLPTIFSSTFSVKGKSYLVTSLENYPFFKRYDPEIFIYQGNENKEQLNSLRSLKKLFEVSLTSKKNAGYISCQLVNLRNVIFPKLATRSSFNLFVDNSFRYLSSRYYHYRIFLKTLKRLDRLIFYRINSITKINDEDKFKILFALHYEPELAVFPLAGEYHNQLEAIKSLSKRVGDSAAIYVKEHPWVFDPSKNRGIVRTKSFYQEILSLSNVRLISYNINSFLLMEKFDCIATLTGTIGWEAFLNGIPTIHFGYAWYGGLPLTAQFDASFNVLQFIRKSQLYKQKINYSLVLKTLMNDLEDFYIRSKYSNNEKYEEKAVIMRNAINKMIGFKSE
ncbi:MAG: hypothetical protein K9I99_14900 [Melioribacteraceae bacterium]|nr:hypothetical protein [Melioribacteraceae bacterium]